MTTKEQEITKMCKKFSIDRLEFSTDEEEEEYFKASLERLYAVGCEAGYEKGYKAGKDLFKNDICI